MPLLPPFVGFYHKFQFLKVRALNGDREEYTQGPAGAAGLGIYTPNYHYRRTGDPNFPILTPSMCRARVRVASKEECARDRALSRLAAIENSKRKARGEDVFEEIKEVNLRTRGQRKQSKASLISWETSNSNSSQLSDDQFNTPPRK